MPAAIVPFNAVDPLCTANQCLQQVVGSIDNNPVAQFSACVSLFGSPTTTTVTVPGDELSSTTTTTIPYTDIIVTLSTTETTFYETSTSYTEVLETDTAFSATSVATVTEVVTAATAVQTVVPKKRANKKRGCKPTSPSLASSASSTAATTSTAVAPFPVASNCANLAEYSSACACISAVSTDVFVTVTIPGETSVVTVTESSPVPSISTSVVTVVVSSTVVVPATTTLASTTTGLFQTTTTVTSTTTPVAPTQTSYLVLNGGARTGKYVKVVSQYLQWDSSNQGSSVAAQFNLITDGGQPSLASDANMKLFVHSASSQVGVLYVETNPQAVASGDKAVYCALDSGVVSCTVPTLGFNTMLQCGAYIYLAKASFTQSGCTVVSLQMST